MNYKIQTAACSGWADLKECDNDSDIYVACTFAIKSEAESELADILDGCDGSPDDWRIVPADMPADCDIYE